MGADYSIPSLLAVLAGEKQHTPLSKNIRRAGPPKVNLLVDIQAKFQAGKGAGYARWAKTFNLKLGIVGPTMPSSPVPPSFSAG